MPILLAKLLDLKYMMVKAKSKVLENG